MSDKIILGDRVTVFFPTQGRGAEFIDGRVIWFPMIPGEQWKIKTDDGCVVVIGCFTYMIKRPQQEQGDE